MARPQPDFVPDDQDIFGVLRRRGCTTLRALCIELWPDVRWRPLREGEICMTEGHFDGIAMTRVEWVWQALGRLMCMERVQVAGQDPDEVDRVAAVVFELVGSAGQSARA